MEIGLSEEDVRNIYITPSLVKKWDLEKQIRSEVYFTDGRINVLSDNKDARLKAKKADYLLFYNSSKPIAVVEAKKMEFEPGYGIQQAIEYALILDLPFAFSSNGKAFVEHDMITGTERTIMMNDFPSPDELWNRYKTEKEIGENEEKIINEPYYYTQGGKSPRYYQRVAINRTCEAIARGQNRILLVMATGTGKTYTASQIIYRLMKSGLKRKVLFLVDRNYLVDQPMAKDFSIFKNDMTKIEHRNMDSSYKIYMGLYQQLTDGQGNDIFTQFSPDFFDLIVVDECHRGSAADDSNWRKILEYYSSATQIGLTATPKETKEISNIDYFGEPIYTYSLKQGIDDGFLAPYKVIRVNLDKDLMGFQPEKGQTDIYGNALNEEEVYYQNDFDKKIIIDERTEVVAKRITEQLKATNRYNKTIVFCVDIDHAERMRQALINENKDLVAENPYYITRITGDVPETEGLLDRFTDTNEKFPCVVTTSKLLTTGVDCTTCKLIVLDTNINSMTEFKQIIGRGTRLDTDNNKRYFTIMDFRNATRLFSDPDFDGDPVSIKEVNPGQPIGSNENISASKNGDKNNDTYNQNGNDIEIGENNSTTKKIHVRGVEVSIYNEICSYYGSDGKLKTESIKDFSKHSILEEYRTLDDFINKWNETDKKQAIIDELKSQGVLIDELRKDLGTDEIGDFDLILHIAYDKKTLKRSERVNNVVKRGYLYKYSEQAQNVLKALLEKYSDNNENDLTDIKILKLDPFSEYGSPIEIVNIFGGREQYIEAVSELENELYKDVA